MQLVIIFVVVLIVIGFLSWFFIVYNGLIHVKENIKKSWANIDVLLMQRSDELPKLIKVVKSFVNHEKTMFDNVLDARTFFLGANTDFKASEI